MGGGGEEGKQVEALGRGEIEAPSATRGWRSGELWTARSVHRHPRTFDQRCCLRAPRCAFTEHPEACSIGLQRACVLADDTRRAPWGASDSNSAGPHPMVWNLH